MDTLANNQTYLDAIEQWRAKRDADMRSEDGWLTVVGLFWLHDGENTIGSDPNSDILLPAHAPTHVGTITFQDGRSELHITTDIPVTVNGDAIQTITLDDDTAEGGATRVHVGNVTFFLIKRSGQTAVRVRDANAEARQTFNGRSWFPVDEAFRFAAAFTSHPTERTIEVENSSGRQTSLTNIGTVTFEFDGETRSLAAFAAGKDEVWIIFRDATSGDTTYKAGRFLYAPIDANGMVDLDFNKAYHPPCAFTNFATCPFPPRENIMAFPISAGERFPE